ncbi:MAG: hypothetical protein ACOCV8_02490 [Spirochaetota bacterium]
MNELNIENIENITILDVCGLAVSQKVLSHNYFAYMHKKAKGKPAQRLTAKIASKEYELGHLYKKFYKRLNFSYSEDKLNVMGIFYNALLNDTPFIPMDKSIWRIEAKSLLSYDDAYNLFTDKNELFFNFLLNLYNKFDDIDSKKIIKAFLSKEKAHKDEIKETLRLII